MLTNHGISLALSVIPRHIPRPDYVAFPAASVPLCNDSFRLAFRLPDNGTAECIVPLTRSVAMEKRSEKKKVEAERLQFWKKG